MAVAKLSKSKKQIQFVDDDGNVYATSVKAVQAMMFDTIKGNFIVLCRFPLKASKDRFPRSPLYDPTGLYKEAEDKKVSEDAFANKTIRDNKQIRQFKDKSVWEDSTSSEKDISEERQI